METDEFSRQYGAADYFIAIIAVLGGASLMAAFTSYFFALAPLILLLMTPVVLVGSARYRRQRRQLAQQHTIQRYSQEPVAVSQSSTSSDMCESAPWR
jgi:sorbitol-specific phosphotransferase system component IIC